MSLCNCLHHAKLSSLGSIIFTFEIQTTKQLESYLPDVFHKQLSSRCAFLLAKSFCNGRRIIGAKKRSFSKVLYKMMESEIYS